MIKKIIIASDSFKGSATSKEIGTYISEGIHRLNPDYKTVVYAIADGGEGTVEALMDSYEGELVSLWGKDPLGNEILASYGLIEKGKTAIIEMAKASGLTLIEKNKLDILQASTYGTGQMILDAVKRGVNKIYIGIGGSATNDGGMGMAEALGVSFLDKNGNRLKGNGENLQHIDTIDLTHIESSLDKVEMIMLSDVNNPLCGPNGAATIYGPQKGATPEIVRQLDAGLQHYASKIEERFGFNISNVEGAGAAGGLGAGLMVFLKAKPCSGIDKVLRLIAIEKDIATADLVITGEGRLDGQTINGKAPIGIASIAKKYHVPTIAIVGSKSLNLDEVYQAGISGVFDIIPEPMSLEEAMVQTPEYVRATAKNIISFYGALNK